MTAFDADIPLPIVDSDSPIDALLNRFTHFGVELGLERIQRLLAALGNPQTQVPILHVAGSNGKGSVCAYLSAVLTHAGCRVGRYTSPHLVSWCERICINGEAIAPSTLHDLLKTVVDAIDPNQSSPTQFEVITAAAWLYFAQQQVDIAVIEVGLGGRLDATNVCDRPLVSVITSLSLEHWQRLGPTLTHIATEKAGILKLNCPAVIAPQPEEAANILRDRLGQLHCPALWVSPARDLGNGRALEQSARYDSLPTPYSPLSIPYSLPLPGEHQLTNSALAIATLRILQQQGWNISDTEIAEGLANTHWPARMQWLTWRDRPLLIDGAHNSAGATMLRQYVDSSPKVTHPISWVMGMISNKDHAEVFRALLRPGDRLFIVPVPDHITAEPKELLAIAQSTCPDLATAKTSPDIFAGLEAAYEGAEHSTVVFCGSLYLIGHFFKLSFGGV
ncbi:bifunctional folylpolyglutamate synthase/dihydrofolate synthase [Leptolyngbya sp. AN02str]|uniref:bifunctional folylpolyglutamate synthase/dihydrofolate synthase n=1 Tax=Leptolyngbya sp. AN02str TaxID=3423363 RepID=UPI003D313A14